MRNVFVRLSYLAALPIFLGGCQDNMTTKWSLIERRSEPTGRETYMIQLPGPNAVTVDPSTGVLSVAGKVEHSIERNVWNVYKREIFHDRGKYVPDPDPDVDYVIDPEGRRDPLYSQASTSIPPSSITGIAREPTGLMVEPVDINAQSGLRIRWGLSAPGAASPDATGVAPIVAGGAFRFPIPPHESAPATRLPVSTLILTLDIDGIRRTDLIEVQRPQPMSVERSKLLGNSSGGQ